MQISFVKLSPESKSVEVTEDEAKDFAELYAAQSDATQDFFGVIEHETKAARMRTLHKAKSWAEENGLKVRMRRVDDETTLAIRFRAPSASDSDETASAA